ncbi:MAG: DNA polymerase I [Leptonema illini]|jgi:DNA polymerase-1|uniref:DNA polymerase I n=1 Tax=Leptonema illini TaxID=183 RepID=A0A833GY56_9LEPT|nr:MAG: DNA polymerase I [Leptonema illini]
MSEKTDLLVIDAHALAYRAYYAMSGQNLLNAEGQPTGAIHGFFRMFFKLLQSHRPTKTAVTWDPSGLTFRNELYSEYKAHRSPMPEDLRFQIDEIKEVLKEAGFSILISPGHEADDIMGALAARFGKKHRVLLLTGDKDCFQLLNKNVHMLRGTKGVSEFIEIDPDWVKSELGVSVKQIPDYMGLVGDTSDNIPGAKGVGPKSAEKLISEYDDIDGIYKNLDAIKPDGLRKKLEESRENVFLSRKLATILTDLDIVAKLDESSLTTPDYVSERVLQLFLQRGYRQIYQELLKAYRKGDESSAKPSEMATDSLTGKGAAKGSKKSSSKSSKKSAKKSAEESTDVSSKKTTESADAASDDAAEDTGSHSKEGLSRYDAAQVDYRLIDSLDELKELVKEMKACKMLCVDTETTGIRPTQADLVGIAVSPKPHVARYIALPPGESLFQQKGISLAEALPLLKEMLEDPKRMYFGQNIKYDHVILKRHGIHMPTIGFDTMIASYLMNPNVRGHNMDDMAIAHLHYDTIKYEDVAGSGRKQLTLDQVDPQSVSTYSCEDADITYRLYNVLAPRIKKEKLDKVHDDIEIPLIEVLSDMEMAGVAIDAPYFAKLSKEYEKKIKSLEKKIYEETGSEFNIQSTKELQTILFEKMKLPAEKKTKTGYSTDQSVLEGLRGLHPVVDHLLDHRKYTKLKSTYVDALPLMLNPNTGRIHTNFSQTIAATGRLSSNDPNLQNIPIREETGRAIRRGFVPVKGNVLLSLDYSQIELRIMAHYAGDKALIDAFAHDLDIHRRTAAALFGVSEESVTPDMRSQAKTVNFSIIYGVTAFGLSQNLGVPRDVAQAYIDRFFEGYPGVRRYMDEMTAYAEKHGYVQTLSGRRRQVLDINSTNRFRKEGAARIAVNTPVQGTSADIIKIAMIRIHEKMKSASYKGRMILQVHDELLFDVPPDEADAVEALARGEMESAMKLKVPLRVDGGRGANWDEAH